MFEWALLVWDIGDQSLPGISITWMELRLIMASDLRSERFEDVKAICPDITVTNDHRELLNGG